MIVQVLLNYTLQHSTRHVLANHAVARGRLAPLCKITACRLLGKLYKHCSTCCYQDVALSRGRC